MTSVDNSPALEPQVTQPADVEIAPSPAPATKEKGRQKVQTLPRKKIVKVLSVGMEVTGKVKRVSEYGAFVDIGVGRDGLLHISELSTGRVRKVDDMIKEGDEITAWIKELDRDKNRISLTMIAPGTKTIRDLQVGELVTGTVQRLTNYGAFVNIGLERDAMLHVKEMGEGYVAKPEDVVKVGEEIEARISGVDARRGRIDLSLKGLRAAAPAAETPNTGREEEFDVEEEEEDTLPTLMEMAFRQALDGDEGSYRDAPARGRKQKRRSKGRDRHDQDDIISRTLRYRG